MRLQWKYALIINLSVLILLAAFYMLLNIKAVDDLGDLYEKGITRGAIFKEITEKTIRPIVEEKMASKEIAEKTIPPLVEDTIDDRQTRYREKLEHALRQLKKDKPNEMRDVLDINVTFGIDARIQASLIPNKAANDHINLTEEGVFEIRKKGFELYRTPQINGKDATAVIIPYSVEFVGEEFDTEPIDGFIQALFAGPDLANHLYRLRVMLLISIIVVSILLVIVIDMMTTRLVIRPASRYDGNYQTGGSRRLRIAAAVLRVRRNWARDLQSCADAEAIDRDARQAHRCPSTICRRCCPRNP